ncbi:MAG: Gfo/Idh/MocA family oxidoreductase [Gemmataceae bacterium]
MTSPFSRREFLERGALLSAAAASLAATPAAADDTKPVSARRSANDRLRVAVVGVNGRGMSHVGGFVGSKKNAALNTEIVAVCDCDEAVIGKAMSAVAKEQGSPPKYVKDFRKLLDDKSIDVISIATPNHWHALMAVWAMRAGKDVYCEKPASHNVGEGRLMVQAARKYDRICQVGTQSRSTKGMRESMACVLDGKIGKVSLSYGTCYKRRPSIGDVRRSLGVQPTPKTMDYDLWCGPARVLPPTRNNKPHGSVHYDWHWIWEYGNGDLGNQGVHEMDKARWALGNAGLPQTVVSVGGRFGYVDDGETANTQLCLMEYPDAHLMFEVRGLPTDKYKGAAVGNIIVGDKGYVVCPSYSSGVVYDPDGKEVAKFNGGGDEGHFANFLKAVRSRKVSDLNCDVEQGHLSAALCHLANVSYRLGAEATFDKDITCFAGCPAAAEAFGRMKQHLVDNKVDLKTAVGRVGPKLTVDGKAEKISGGADLAKANALLFREYRKGFDITEAV